MEMLRRILFKSNEKYIKYTLDCSGAFHENPTNGVVAYYTTRTATSVDGRTWFSHKTFFFVYFVMDAYNVLSALKEFRFVAHSSCILPKLDHAEKCLNIQVTDFYRQWYFSLSSVKHQFVKTCIEGAWRHRRCHLHPLLLHWVDVSGQHHVPAALSPKKNSGYPQYIWMFTVTCNALLCDRLLPGN
jgi:hypothetical protein